jgi:hypothetical protein
VADRPSIANRSSRHDETQYSESHPTSAHIANRLQPEFPRLNALPSAATAALKAFFDLFADQTLMDRFNHMVALLSGA